MQICSELRKTKSNGILVNTIINSIRKERNKSTTKKTIVYLVDQLKNLGEYKVLSHTYGLNYIQISLFSNEKERDQNLKERFEPDAELEKKYDEKSLTHCLKKTERKNIF
jgi:undecaprenyl pyrophosphate synthase